MKWKFYSLAFVAGMSILTACSSDDNNDNDGNGGNGNGNEIENGTILKGTITSDVTLGCRKHLQAERRIHRRRRCHAPHRRRREDYRRLR